MVVRSDPAYRAQLSTPSGTIQLSRFQHLSIPSDYVVHFTGPGGRLFFEAPSVLPTRLFSFVSRDVHTYPDSRGRWKGVAVVTALPRRDPARRFLLDFYLHTIGTSKNDILALPPTEWGSEYAGLRDGNCIGPFSLPLDPAAPQAAIMCSVRFGSCLTGESDAETFVVPREAR